MLSKLIEFDDSIGATCCGIDEVGRGSLAGPVYVAAVYLQNAEQLVGLNDSKKLSPKKREELFSKILDSGSVYGVGVCDTLEIAELNILNATMLACTRAYDNLITNLSTANLELPTIALMDGNKAPNLGVPVRCVVGGDALSASIAASSIIAKVLRDRHMDELAKKYPQYGFEKHKGYGTIMHRRAIREYGGCDEHRELFLRRILK